eukprot:2699680-Amphidinium_carterae.2
MGNQPVTATPLCSTPSCHAHMVRSINRTQHWYVIHLVNNEAIVDLHKRSLVMHVLCTCDVSVISTPTKQALWTPACMRSLGQTMICHLSLARSLRL